MAMVGVLGSGFAGQTCAFNLKKSLSKKDEVVVVTPQEKFGYIPSYIWVGIGKMDVEKTQFKLAPVFKKMGIGYVQGLATQVYTDDQYVIVTKDGKEEKVSYDYLVNATGPKLNFAATKGLGPIEGNSVSVCTPTHAVEAASEYKEVIKKLEQGIPQTLVIGTGHGMATCQGAAFEYIHNIAFDLEERGLLELANIIWISNEQAAGDFGVGGMVIEKGNYKVSGKMFAESTFVEKGIEWITGAHVKEVRKNALEYIDLDGNEETLTFDFAMLIPAFAGVPMQYINKNGDDITNELCAPNNMLKVDADYSSAGRGYDNWKAGDWPRTYQNPQYKNLFAAGIAFAPPHPISKPGAAPDGTPITATPPRTGMASAIIGHTVALNVADMVKGKEPSHSASMAEFGAACVASMGKSFWRGSAATMVMYPVVPDYDKYETGRDLSYTFGDQGRAGHWLKAILHHTFIYKMQGKFGWSLIPD
jgi:sulfide:quinone oxidoreductase